MLTMATMTTTTTTITMTAKYKKHEITNDLLHKVWL